MKKIKEKKVHPNLEKKFPNHSPIPNTSNISELTKMLFDSISTLSEIKYSNYLTENKKNDMALIIATAIVTACMNLAIPIPKVAIHPHRNYNGMAFHGNRYEIWIGEAFLFSLRNTPLYLFTLSAFVFHECFHAYQVIHFSNRRISRLNYLNSMSKNENQNLVEFFKLISRDELSADLYALKQIQNCKTNSTKMMLGKILSILSLSLDISIKKLGRKVVKNTRF